MDPKTVAFYAGAYVARLNPAIGGAPWPGWFGVGFDRDPMNDFARWTLTQPESGANKFRAENVAQPGCILSFDFTQFGGGVCQGVYATPPDGAWGGHEQLIGWMLGSGGPDVVFVRQVDGSLSIGLAVVEL